MALIFLLISFKVHGTDPPSCVIILYVGKACIHIIDNHDVAFVKLTYDGGFYIGFTSDVENCCHATIGRWHFGELLTGSDWTGGGWLSLLL